MRDVLAHRGKRVCVLASGDPFLFGVGATLSRVVPAAEIRTLPAPSAFSLAASRLGWPLQEVETISLHGRAIDLILRRGRTGELYNIGSGVEQSVEQITDQILALLGKPASLKTYVPDRPGHDRRYLLNSEKIRRELGWKPLVPFEDGMRRTVAWYVDNEEWWRPLLERLAVKEGAWGR